MGRAAGVTSKRRSGFTLVEMLTVILVIGMLMALLLTAIQSARESARRTQCLSKLNQLASAMHQFEANDQQYPGWRHYPYPAIDVVTAQPFRYSTGWFAQLLPYLGYEFLTDRTMPFTLKRPLRKDGLVYGYSPSLHNVAVCPSDAVKMKTPGQRLSYAVNCGRKDVVPTPVNTTPSWPADWRANGMFHNLRDYWGNPNLRVVTVKMDSSFIRGGDGLATTLMLSENKDVQRYYDRNETRNGFVFDWPMSGEFQAINGPGFDGTYLGQPDGESYATARPSSFHRGGVNAAFADGHGRFLNDRMDYLVYVALMTTKGSEAREPGSTTYSKDVVPPLNQPKLTEDQF